MTRNRSAARELAQGAVERMGPAALDMPDAHLKLVESYGLLRSDAIAIVNAEKEARSRKVSE